VRGRGAHVRSFVTIDPERDGPAQLKDYLADWDPRILGLTGTPEQVDCVCKDFRVYYAKVRPRRPGSSAAPFGPVSGVLEAVSGVVRIS
jgi:cytochrome oxidase Cu insertion factor (SCO1/SenC/PrrC family)